MPRRINRRGLAAVMGIQLTAFGAPETPQFQYSARYRDIVAMILGCSQISARKRQDGNV